MECEKRGGKPPPRRKEEGGKKGGAVRDPHDFLPPRRTKQRRRRANREISHRKNISGSFVRLLEEEALLSRQVQSCHKRAKDGCTEEDVSFFCLVWRFENSFSVSLAYLRRGRRRTLRGKKAAYFSDLLCPTSPYVIQSSHLLSRLCGTGDWAPQKMFRGIKF